ncbi:6-phosphogluconate dehydrogenase [Plectosphaerella plurivora]|uniref:6-phosphogluconate dehydrogenase n=1 Tax=Plectosphaerella plurivora TaxID=936078 RepID=A0A9P8VHT1_9PEZI|nr:6-phosphogluconate dehydrogenase [Plectosphaerella plurivora]
MASPSAVAVLSIGDMGVGIARLLISQGFKVVTNVTGRSEDTATRARDAGVELLATDSDLVAKSAIVLSVVPPRDAAATAQRIIDALPATSDSARNPLYYADLNAVSPATASEIAALFARARSPVRFVDGCILGGPPRQTTTPDPGTNASTTDEAVPSVPGWVTPGIPTSGPHPIASIPDIGERLSSTLSASHIAPTVGAASGLKMCFASLSKGFTALAVESFTTAHRLGVLSHLRAELADRLPLHAQMAERSVVTMPPKAYRWVREMEEISATHRNDGGFADEAMFRGAASIYRTIAEDTVLGEEKIGKRKRGTTLEDLAAAVSDGLDKKRKKTE